MKNRILKSLVLATAFFCAIAAQAQTVKILSINSGKVLAGYYKAQQYSNALSVQKAGAEQALASQQKELQKLQADALEISNSFKSTPDSDSAKRLQLSKDFDLKVATFNSTRDALQNALNKEQGDLNKNIQDAQQAAARDIVAATNIVAKNLGATVVLDLNNVVYIDSTTAKDISDDVLAVLNKDQPKDMAKPADAKPAADAKAPAAK
jgi:Skp family chaperone for outer membrane proteins